MNPKKLKHSEIKEFRDFILKTQDHRCALCGGSLSASNAALDHCHKTGRVRGVVHPDCNILLGKIENYVNRQGQSMKRRGALPLFLRAVYKYMITDYRQNPFHPKHLTPTERKIKLYRKRLRTAKRKETQLKYKELIKKLQDKTEVSS
jgi:hypothetical protein